jgi:hypothetical protein
MISATRASLRGAPYLAADGGTDTMIVTLRPIKMAVVVMSRSQPIFRIEGSKSDSPLLGFKEIDSGPLLSNQIG